MIMENRRDSVVMYRNQLEALLACSPKDCRLILAAMREYGMNGNDVDIPEHLFPLWIMFKFSIDETNRKYKEISEKRRNAAQIGNKQMRANAANSEQTQTNASKCEQTLPIASKRKQTRANAAYNENDNDNENDISHSNECDIKNAQVRDALGDQVLNRFNAWLETWQDIHGDGKPMPRHTQESQIQALLHLPGNIRLEAVEAAIKGCWKNIRDIRNGFSGKPPNTRQTGVLQENPVYSPTERGS